MFLSSLHHLKRFLAINPQFEASLPPSYVAGFKSYNPDDIETIKPLIMSLFQETHETETGELLFIEQEKYLLTPEFCHNPYLLNDNDSYHLLAICFNYFPAHFEDYIILILTHPELNSISEEALEKASNHEFIGENALENWRTFIDHHKPEKSAQVLINCLDTFLNKKLELTLPDISPIPDQDLILIIHDMLDPTRMAQLNQYFPKEEQIVFFNTLIYLEQRFFWGKESHIQAFKAFIQQMRIDGICDIYNFFQFPLSDAHDAILETCMILIFQHAEHSKALINIFVHLALLDQLLPQILRHLETHTHIDTIAEIINTLSTAGIMTMENTEVLLVQFLPHVERLQQSEAINLFLFGIANEHDFEPEDWQNILQLIMQQAPEDEIRQHILTLLHGVEGFDIDDDEIEEMIFNDEQSTHTASVHESVSQSVIRLKTHYPTDNEAKIFYDIDAYFQKIKENDWQYAAAYRAFKAIKTQTYCYHDHVSDVSLKQLVSLTWLAIMDDTQRIGYREDVLDLWVQGLYDIQRGYNRPDHAGMPDNHICASGAFNKLVQSIAACHPSIELHFINIYAFGLKLKATIQNIIIEYLSLFANPQNLKEFFTFNQMVSQIKQNGLDDYWPKMKVYLQVVLFNEFKSLFSDIQDPKFLGVIDSGEFVEIKHLEQFQQNIAASQGYHQFCRASLFQRLPYSDNQHEFDKRFGLTCV